MIQLPSEFDDIRPYYDSEIPAAMERMASNPILTPALRFVDPHLNVDDFRVKLRKIKTTDQFQQEVMVPLCEAIIAKTMTGFTSSGCENIDHSCGTLYISNHRDIVMDAYLHSEVLLKKHYPTCHITFGSNLMEPRFVVDFGMSNKMFRTDRKSSNVRSFLRSSRHLSAYINYVVSHGESLWIAQRNGRTKDGLDRTEPGLVRMLLMNGNERSRVEALHITPLAISYQWEPCDILKAVELYRSLDGRPYVKAPGEDLQSIITGITQPKGCVHLAFGHPIDTSGFADSLRREDIHSVAAQLDAQIWKDYHLWDTNYLAWDLLNDSHRFGGMYDPALRERFLDKMRRDIGGYPALEASKLREIYLKIYAGPVYNSPGALPAVQ
ncbi:MAG: 1-acyl-sn-glycerol-3-phosphate acyltransferase [Bacteroidales bacterium]|nr:1-acyl-sn-glycerol-3-phosphate acyltransferase [Bacteroidales bacterium]